MKYLYPLGFLWALPLTLVGLVIALLSKPRSWGFNNGAIEAYDCDIFFKTGPGILRARTIGVVVTYSPHAPPLLEFKRTKRHERWHVKSGLILGPLILLAYPLASLWCLLNKKHAYYDNWFEIAARKAAGQHDPRG